MFHYGLGEAGKKLLLKLTAKPNATAAPSEPLAAEYARANRKPKALAILQKIAAYDNLKKFLRAAGTLSDIRKALFPAVFGATRVRPISSTSAEMRRCASPMNCNPRSIVWPISRRCE